MQTTAASDSISIPATTIPATPDNQQEARSETINRIATSAHQTVDRMAQGADGALQSLRSGSEAWKETGDQSLERVQAYVRQKPLTALGMAVAAGFVLSRLIR
jgi:ElaB/YqjD/DUF883 family membrane-anchored ribosome-binding protein